MKIIKPSIEWTYGAPDGMKFLQAIELAGRTCYKSEGKITEAGYRCGHCNKFISKKPPNLELGCPNCSHLGLNKTESSAEKFVQNLINRGHLAMVEHAPDISIRFICDRGVTHEIVTDYSRSHRRVRGM